MYALPSIPGYQLEVCLGGGPMTVVYSARDARSGSACAVKTVRAEWDDQPTAIKLLRREALAGFSVRHPHIVRVNDAHVTCAPYFLVMDLLSGESLRRRIRRDFRLDVPTTIWIGRQIACALTELHRQGFVHGDIKPENVLLREDGTAMLIDLGFAHRPGENASLLEEGYVLGTANYLAPELCGLEPGRDSRSDLFSLGVTLFEMLTGTFPYPVGTLSQTMRRHRCDPPASIRDLRKIPSPLADLIDRLLAHKCEQRPDAKTTADQLVRFELAILRRRRRA